MTMPISTQYGPPAPTGGFNPSSLPGGYDPTQAFNSPQLQTAQQNYTTAATNALNEQTSADTLPTMLKAVLNEKFGQNNPQVQNVQNAEQNYLNSTTAAPLSVLPENNHGVIFSPLQQANLINQRESGPLSALTTANYLLGLESGGLPNIIDTAAAAAKAKADQAQGAATIAGNTFSNLLDEIKSQVGAQTQEQSNILQEEALSKQLLLNPQYQKALVLQTIQSQVQGGRSFNDLLSEFGQNPYITPQDILNIYNEANPSNPARVPYQQAKNLNLNTGQNYTGSALGSVIGSFFSPLLNWFSNLGKSHTSQTPVGMGSIIMTSPSGQQYNVPAGQVSAAKAKGWK